MLMTSYGVVEQNGKFVVTKNGQPINLPSSSGSSIVTVFDTKSDAERYLGILKNLTKSKR
jgi:hypothetical protein